MSSPDTNAAAAAAGVGTAGVEAQEASWPRFAIALLARVPLLLLAGFTLWALLPAVLGWHPSVVMSGSMEPVIKPGDIVVAKPVDTAKITLGQVLLVDDPDHPDKRRLHRLIAIDDNGMFHLQGDANAEPDSTPVDPATVHGVGVLRIPLVGLPIVWVGQHRYGALGLAAGAICLLFAATRLDRRRPDGADDAGDSGDSGTPGEDRGLADPSPETDRVPAFAGATPRDRRLVRALRVARTATLTVLTVGLVLGTTAEAHAAWRAPTSSAGSWASGTVAAPTGVDAGCALWFFKPINVTWAAPTGGSGFTIERANGGAYTSVGTATATQRSFTDSTAQSLVTYTYRVVSKDGTWTSAPSTPSDGVSCL
jgi:signal peptidase